MLNYRELKRMCDSAGPRRTVLQLREALAAKQLEPAEFGLRTLAEALIPEGREFLRHCAPGRKANLDLREAVETDVSAFAAVAGELLSTQIMAGYRQEQFVASSLVRTIPTQFDGEKLAGLTGLGDVAELVEPGQPYPRVGFAEDFIETPATQKRGLICAVTKEALFFDRTQQIYDQAFRVGEALALAKEKRILDCVLGLVNTYKWRGIAYDTYQTTEPWKNVVENNELVDWRDVDEGEQLFADMLDPHTNEPVLIHGGTLLVMPAKFHTAHAILHATEIRTGDGGTLQTVTRNPLSGGQVVMSRLAYRRLTQSGIDEAEAKKYWYQGDFKRAFAYMENWPLTIAQAAPHHADDFDRDIVLQMKASERGSPAVLDPRYVIQHTP